MQLGFVIDHTRCIGCHACTVACKAENDVPLGNFRTWVKYTEEGSFPQVKRSFAVLRCNQCTDAPCVQICPVRALQKRPDGIVDVDPQACIGCKACMQGCPYDALYLNDATGTAEKCHFCLHRTEIGLAPACAVVCPTEAIVPGDFHDPASRVSRLKREHDLVGRKPEAGTGPNVLYREVAAAGIDPLRTTGAGGYLWADRLPGPGRAAEAFDAGAGDAALRARTTYNVDHKQLWGWPVSAYLLTKSLAAGLFLAAVLLASPLGPEPGLSTRTALVLGASALLFLLVTALLLVVDLARPARFLYVLTRPNWNSWLAKGSLILTAYGLTAGLWTLGVAIRGPGGPVLGSLMALGSVLAAASAAYTGWLFAQAKGRVLWMRRGLGSHLVVQALLAGFAGAILLLAPLGAAAELAALRSALVLALVGHAIFALTEHRAAPRGRGPEYARAIRLVTRGPYAARHHGIGMALGLALPLALIAASASPAALAVASALALVGLSVEEDTLVRAGQALPIS